MRHVRVGHEVTSQIVCPPQFSRRRSEQRPTVFSQSPPTVQRGGEYMSVLSGERKETPALWQVSSASDVVTGLKAIVKA